MEEWIKKSDAIEAINKSFDKETLLKCFVRKIAIDAIIQVPSADRPQGEWITCSEREPNEFEDVLVLLSDGTMDVLQITDYLDIWGNVKWCHAVNYGMGYAVSGNEVVAWMPLPEPWKGAENSKECHKPQSLYYRAFCEERKDSAYCDGCEFWY